MQTSECDFADGVETANGGFGIHIGHDAAALVVRGGDDRDGFLQCVMSVRKESFVNEGEAFGEVIAEWGDVKEDAGCAGTFDFGVDGAGDDIARGK